MIIMIKIHHRDTKTNIKKFKDYFRRYYKSRVLNSIMKTQRINEVNQII